MEGWREEGRMEGWWMEGDGGQAGWRGVWLDGGGGLDGGGDGGSQKAGGLDGGGWWKAGLSGWRDGLTKPEPNRTARRTAANRANRNRIKSHLKNRNEPKRNAALLLIKQYTLNYKGLHIMI